MPKNAVTDPGGVISFFLDSDWLFNASELAIEGVLCYHNILVKCYGNIANYVLWLSNG